MMERTVDGKKIGRSDVEEMIVNAERMKDTLDDMILLLVQFREKIDQHE